MINNIFITRDFNTKEVRIFFHCESHMHFRAYIKSDEGYKLPGKEGKWLQASELLDSTRYDSHPGSLKLKQDHLLKGDEDMNKINEVCIGRFRKITTNTGKYFELEEFSDDFRFRIMSL